MKKIMIGYWSASGLLCLAAAIGLAVTVHPIRGIPMLILAIGSFGMAWVRFKSLNEK